MPDKVLAAAVISARLLAGGGDAPPPAPTFHDDIAPILQRHCVSCHRPGQAAPFSLTSYDAVRQRATLIVQVTRERVMPPWQPDPGYGEFEGARRLSEAAIATIERWVRAGAPEGAARDDPSVALPVEPDLGPPDAVLTLQTPYTFLAHGRDQIRTFVIPTAFSGPRYVRAIAFSPGATVAIHHANIKVDSEHSSRWLDDEDTQPGYEGGGGRRATFPDGHFLGWTSGQSARRTDAAPWTLESGADLVLELHLTPTGRRESIQPTVTLYFTDHPAALTPYMIRLGRQDLDIPAGERAHSVVDRYTLPVAVQVLAVQPHAHSLARTVTGYATLPGGIVEPLIRISQWNPRWQDVYRYASPVRLPAGTTLTLEYVFDNSDGNPRNPHRPARRVTFGQTASSEMGDLWLQVLTANVNDRRVLQRDFDPKMLRDDIAGALKVVEVSPDDARAHTEVALCYVAADRPGEALAHFEAAARLAPDSVGAQLDLGVGLLRARRFEEARAHLLAAVALRPDLADAYGNLGAVSYGLGQFADAAAWYERALGLDPLSARNEYNLARAYVAGGRPADAVPRYEAAIRLAPRDALALAGLASVLATSGEKVRAVDYYRRALAVQPALVPALVDLAWILATAEGPLAAPDEAIALAHRADAETAGKNPVVLDTLAVAYAAAGRYAEAARIGERALTLAVNERDTALAARIRLRLQHYVQQLGR